MGLASLASNCMSVNLYSEIDDIHIEPKLLVPWELAWEVMCCHQSLTQRFMTYTLEAKLASPMGLAA